MSSIQYDWYPYKKRSLDIKIYIKKKQCEETQGEDDYLQTKEEDWNRSSSYSTQKELTLLYTLILDF